MGPLTKVLLVLALVVPVTAYVAGSLASSGGPEPADRSPVIIQDQASTQQPTPEQTREQTRNQARPSRRPTPSPSERPGGSDDQHQQEARVVTPLPTPVGEDDDDEWDDDGPEDDDDTDDDGGRDD